MPLQPILSLIFMAVIVGGVLYLFNMLPIDATVKKVVFVLAMILIILWAIKWLMGMAH